MKRARVRKPAPMLFDGVECGWLEKGDLPHWRVVWEGGWGPPSEARRLAKWLLRAADWCEAQQGRGR